MLQAMILTAPAMDALNSFDKPRNVQPSVFSAARIGNGLLSVKIPAKSIVVLSETP
jgi:alpha-L-arabinofuranosidase